MRILIFNYKLKYRYNEKVVIIMEVKMYLIVFYSNFIYEYGYLNFILFLFKKNFVLVYLFNIKENVWFIMI